MGGLECFLALIVVRGEAECFESRVRELLEGVAEHGRVVGFGCSQAGQVADATTVQGDVDSCRLVWCV